jgi:hypothetical protein
MNGVPRTTGENSLAVMPDNLNGGLSGESEGFSIDIDVRHDIANDGNFHLLVTADCLLKSSDWYFHWDLRAEKNQISNPEPWASQID